MTPEFMADWVAAAPDAPTRELRMAVHTILAAVSRAPRLPNHMVLKGGIPLALEYQGDRFTRDIDFSTAKTVPDMAVEGVVEELAAAFACRFRCSITDWTAGSKATSSSPRERIEPGRRCSCGLDMRR